MDEKKLEGVQELKDEQLGDVTGGLYPVERFGHIYIFKGSEADADKAFNCPKCFGGLIHTKLGSEDLWRCPNCKRNYFTKEANPNFASGLWMKLN